MRNNLYLLLFITFMPVMLMGQNKQMKPVAPGHTIIIQTTAGTERSVAAPLKPLKAPASVPKTVSNFKSQSAPLKRMSATNDFQKVMRKLPVSSAKEGSAKELPVYSPGKKQQSAAGFQKRMASYYESIYINDQSDIDNFDNLYPDCEQIGTLTLEGDIFSLEGLNGVSGVGRLEIINTPLPSLSEWHFLTAIFENLRLDGNGSMYEIGLQIGQLGGLEINDMHALQTLEVSPWLTSIDGDVLISGWQSDSLAGLSNITSITGDLTIRISQMTSLQSLSNLQAVGFVTLEYNEELSSIGFHPASFGGLILEGLSNLTSLGSFTQNLVQSSVGTVWLSEMPLLTDISGLNNLSFVANLVVSGCNQLENLQGLQNVQAAPYGISLYYNNSLNNLSALSSITTVEYGRVDISGNPALLSLAGMQNITMMDALAITYNAKLADLNALNPALEIYNVNNNDLQIYYNPGLLLCSVPAICNYLNGPKAVSPQIFGNAGACADLISVKNSCGDASGCGSKEYAEWTGSVSSDWNDPENWSTGRVPGPCSVVIINNTDGNSPSIASGADIVIGGLVMSDAYLFLKDCTFTIKDSFDIYNSYLYDNYDYGYSTVRVLNAMNPKFTYSQFVAANGKFELLNYQGAMDFYQNSVYGNVLISDAPARNDRVYIFGNYVAGSVVLNNNSSYGNMYLANGNEVSDEIEGSLTVNNTTSGSVDIGLGIGEPLLVAGNVTINQELPNTIYLDKITFTGSSFQSFTMPPASTGIIFRGANNSARDMIDVGGASINSLFFRKTSGSFLVFRQPVTVKQQLVMGAGIGAILSQADKMLTLEKDAVLVDEDPVAGTFVEGPMKKIGNAAFTFPLGKSVGMPMRMGNGSLTGIAGRQMELYGDFKAPLTISAPLEDYAEFVAEYKRENPAYSGYDPAVREPGLDGIITDEYWILKRENGTSDVAVTLSYDQSRTEASIVPANLQITGWDGTKWISHTKGAVTGDAGRGTVSTGSPLSVYGPLAFFSRDMRTPLLTITQPEDTLFCRGSSFWLHFTLDTLTVESMTFFVERSDENGDFGDTPMIVASKQTNQSDSILVNMPSSWVTAGSKYHFRIRGDKQPVVSENVVSMTASGTPQVVVSVVGPTDICLNTGPVKYYPSEKEAGVTYNWTVTGGTLVTNNDTAFVTFTGVGSITVQVTPSNECGDGTAASRTVTVKAGAPVTTPVLSNTGRRIHVSTPPAVEQVTGIRWYRNGSVMTGVTGNEYYASEAGTFTVEFTNDCGVSPVSDAIIFENASVSQTITFDALPDRTYGDEPFSLPATASSGLPVLYELISGTGNITEGVFTITQTGTVTIRAYQLGDNTYDTAASVTRSFVIGKGPQTIAWDPMPDYDYKGSTIHITLPRFSSGGIPIVYETTSPNVSLNGAYLQINGIGSVTITAKQAGDVNHLPADQVTQTFCVGVSELTAITGAEYVCPGQEAVYSINKISGLQYRWELSDGTLLPSDTDTVKIAWTTTGSYTLYVSATGPCGPPTARDSIAITVMDGVTSPVAVTNMLPSDGSTDQKLPLTLSWIPGSHTLSYDVFVWENGTPRPATPFAANLAQINYTVPTNAGLIYDKIYNWQVVSKNGCLETAGPVQMFRLRKATDLAVTQVSAPLTVNSGQKITINWTVKNIGEGNTLTNEKWSDAVFLSFDTSPDLLNPLFDGLGWSVLQFPVKPLLIGTRSNVTALNAGQEYTNSIDFNVPLSYSQPLYVYVVTNYKGGADAPPQSDVSNDTARQQEPINVVLTPTPDLRVDTLLIPGTTFSGSRINVTYKVKNYGALTPAGSKWNDKIYISKSPLFVKKNAIQLEFPNQNEMYYPATKATVPNATLLQTDSSVTRSVEVIIPNFISGTWFIHVVANDDQLLYEGALAENNETNKAIQILLTPTPQLTINSLNVPLTNMSTTQTVGINWNVLNSGFFDNIEKNKGFYGGQRGVCNSGGAGSGGSGPLNSMARNSGTSVKVAVIPKEFDSLSWGSSYWVDKVYLSTNPSVLQTGSALLLGEIPKGIKDLGWQMPLDVRQNFEHCGDGGHGPIPGGTTANVLRPGSNHPNNLTFRVPADLPDGDYYFYVQTNSTKTVFTYVDTPVVRRSGKVTISRPDLSVTALSLPANITGGTPFTINYTVSNSGQGSIYNTKRTDRIYMSHSPVYDGSAQLVKTVSFTEDVITGTPVNHTVEHTLPNDISGTRYFFICTNADSAFAENNFNNNVSAAAIAAVTTAAPVDLVVNNIRVADTSYIPGTIIISYSIQNNGTNTAIGETIDSIYISCDPVFNKTTAVAAGIRANTRNIVGGANVSDTVTVTISKQAYLLNTCFAKGDFSKVYFYVKANAHKSIYEAGDTTNNVGSSGEKTFANRNVDLTVTNVSGPDNGTVGRPYPLAWKLTNEGLVTNSQLFYDEVLLLTDSTNLADAVTVISHFNKSTFSPGSPNNIALSPVIPKVPTGDYYLMVKADSKANLDNEIHLGNNRDFLRDENGKAKKIHIVQPLLSDLISEITSAPASVPVGQPVTVKYKVTNAGDGVTYPDAWMDYVWLSKNLKPDSYAGDKFLSTKWYKGTVEAGGSYEDSITVTIPINTPAGNYMLITSPDEGNRVIEMNDTNNLGLKPIVVYIPEPVDLVVKNVMAPDTVYLGYPVDSVRWHVQNNSANPAGGVSTDGIYLSKNPVYDSSAILIGLKNKKLAMTALATDTLAFAPVINNVPEGEYYIIVRTDLLNNIPETDRTNNEGVTAQQVYVSVKELKLGETLPDTMSVPKYYKLNIPDSLLGATVLLTLKSEDSLTQRNELYVGGGYIPSVLKSDYKFNTPNYGNQDILISDITEPVYYISVRSVSPVIQKQNITLHAVKLPFAVLTAQSNRGGNGGNVTVKLSGSLFTDSMSAKLVNGGTTIEASKVYFINSTVVYATFPLQGKSLGVYDIVLTKNDETEATLKNGFSVVSPDNGGLYATGMNTGPTGPGTQPGCDPGAPAGLNSQLVTELMVPEKVFAGWPFVIQINYSNPTNMDIPVQTKVLYNDYNVPMSFSKDGLADGISSLFIEISESDGPPGVIRAGSSGSITIYSVTPVDAPAHDRIKFNLK